MYTRCPECSIAFRVTAKVLQQAGGNVRCGGCNHAFNALHYLSEEMPTEDDGATGSAGTDKLAETSRRLLETLDELAGPEEVRIEDTGIEWRVLDKDDEGDTDNESEEMRYDDSTLLPDDFGLDGDEAYEAPPLTRRSSDQPDAEFLEPNDLQGDLLLSEPEDWTDLLDEVRDPEPESESLEVEEELAAIHNQLSTREDSGGGPADLDSQFGMQAEAMGLAIPTPEEALTDEVPLLAEDDIERLVDSDAIDDDEVEEQPDEDSDVVIILEDEATDSADEPTLADSEATKIDELDNDVEDSRADAADDATDDEEEPEDAIDADDYEEDDESGDEVTSPDRKSAGEFESQIDEAARAPSDDDEDVAPLALEGESMEDEGSAESEHFVPPPTEEEMTVNMEIDQEMMALATQDDDFSATLFGVKNPEDLFNENSEEVETIVMEGESIRGSIERERLAAESAAKSQFDDPASLVDTYALSRNKLRGGRRKYDPAGYGMTIAVVVLALTLVGQIIHNSRESLATVGLFNQTIAPIYRMLGSPVTPSWDIKGWQFEATNGNVDEDETALTIVSRIVNRSKKPLPYPLVHVSLTDRWEDIMGSRILEPGEYLAGDLDPSSPVLPGENFTAVISIENPSAEATGFKLNVCYRVAPGTVRCAIEDFKE